MLFTDRRTSKLIASLGIALLVSSGRVFACEGDCIVSITDALIGNYTNPMNLAMSKLADTIVSQLIPNNNAPPTSYLNPIVEEYNRRAYDNMEHAIFPSYFHGKCQDSVTGIDPPGCPNPDCPVVCGTPGSMVHFYSHLRSIAYQSTVGLINDIAKPGSSAYRKVEKLVAAAASSHTARKRRFRFMRSDEDGPFQSAVNLRTLMEKRSSHVQKTLQSTLGKFDAIMNGVCGGTDSLPNCSWENAMKEYILSFP